MWLRRDQKEQETLSAKLVEKSLALYLEATCVRRVDDFLIVDINHEMESRKVIDKVACIKRAICFFFYPRVDYSVCHC